ncbi:hypothetical protein AWC38_SpisGene3067 [Stylophora pistillata]|uniref:Uncharacterized protein n=1 Tax=Stylophora pistillata TaxID=50429 RepID=A0A2B4STA6_STYPI|nr:hypothetical protein AWC38_SpisGene3067 [Stylophora pistillata]
MVPVLRNVHGFHISVACRAKATVVSVVPVFVMKRRTFSFSETLRPRRDSDGAELLANWNQQHDSADFIEPLESAMSHVLIPAITGRKCNQLERDVSSLPARFGGLGLGNSLIEAPREYKTSVGTTAPLAEQIKAQQHHLPEDSTVKSSKQTSQHKKDEDVKERVKSVYERAPLKTKRALDMATEKGSSRHNELRDLEAELLGIVCKDVEIEPQLQDTTGEQLNSGSNMAKDARLDIHARGF